MEYNLIFSIEFKNYCKELCKKFNITIIDIDEWCRTVKSKGWNQLKLYFNIYKKNYINSKLTTENLIVLYKANIRLRNTLYKYALFIEEYFKSWLFYKKYDFDNKLNNLSIGNLIKKVSDEKKKKFLVELGTNINENKFNIIYESWRNIRNLVCHRGIKILLSRKQLFFEMNQMMLLLDNKIKHKSSIITVRKKFIKEIEDSLKYVKDFIQKKWGNDIICLLKN